MLRLQAISLYSVDSLLNLLDQYIYSEHYSNLITFLNDLGVWGLNNRICGVTWLWGKQPSYIKAFAFK